MGYIFFFLHYTCSLTVFFSIFRDHLSVIENLMLDECPLNRQHIINQIIQDHIPFLGFQHPKMNEFSSAQTSCLDCVQSHVLHDI